MKTPSTGKGVRGAGGLLLLFLCLLTGCRPAVKSPVQAPPAVTNAPAPTNGFYLQDGDRVLFYGDSITEMRKYTTYVESYCVSRFPDRHVTFVTSGVSGEKVSGGAFGLADSRLQRDVFPYRPTVVTICLGMNDGSIRPFQQRRFDHYVKGYRKLIEMLKQNLPGVRLTLITVPAYDDVTSPPAFPGGYNGVLRRMNEAVHQLANEYGATFVEANTPMVEMLKKAKKVNSKLASRIITWRIHPANGGHLLMASAILKAWNAPATVAEVEIGAAQGKVIRSEGAQISDAQVTSQAVRFRQQDTALPWPFDRDYRKNPDMPLVLGVTDIEQSLNRFRLKVTGLKASRVVLRVDGKPMGSFRASALAQGIDLTRLPEHPANRMSQQVLALTYRHNQIYFDRWRQIVIPGEKRGVLSPEAQKKVAEKDAEEAKVVQERSALFPLKPYRVELLPEGTAVAREQKETL